MPRPRKISPKPTEWYQQTQDIMKVQRQDGASIAVVIQHIDDPKKPRMKYVVLAVMTTATTAEDVLENHAHQLVGYYASNSLARGGGEKYVKAWMKMRAKAEKCACKDEMPKDTLGALKKWSSQQPGGKSRRGIM